MASKMKREDSLSCFKELQNSTAKQAMVGALKKLVEGAEEVEAAQAELEAFVQLFDRFISKSEEKISWDKIKPPPQGMVRLYNELAEVPESDIRDQLEKLVVVKLNGGLGTTMGCTGPKSVIEVRDDMTFLDLTVRQIEWLNETYGTDVPLILMNSFNTHADTEKIIQKYAASPVTILTFNQSRFPRFFKESLLPCPTNWSSPNDMWYPPGHGDVYGALKRSGVLDGLLAKGKEIMFMSNIDNLGATVDLNILNFFDKNETEFIMEVTNKTQADVKGGTLIDYEGQCRLLEIAQVPKDHVEEFKSIKKFRIFNTNNLWMKLNAVDRLVRANELNMEIIINDKTLDGQKIVQLETACGAAIKYFKGGNGMGAGALVMSPERPFPTVPLVKLGDEHFKKVSQFMDRFAKIPNIVELDHLTVTGDVTLGPGVILRGTVIIVANHGARIDIPAGAILENKVVSGNLRILDH